MQFIFIKINLILIYLKRLHLLLLHKYHSFLRCSVKLWLFHVHPLFQNSHLSSSYCGHFYTAAQVHITIPHLLAKQSVTEICVFTFYFLAHKYTIFSSLLTVLHNKLCNYKCGQGCLVCVTSRPSFQRFSTQKFWLFWSLFTK